MPEKSKLRSTISRWANSSDQHARDLRRTHTESGELTIAEAPDRAGRRAARHAAHRHPAPARRRTGSGGRARRRLRGAHHRVAGPATDRRHQPRPVDARRRPDRQPRRRSDHVQPALRADAVTVPDPEPSPGTGRPTRNPPRLAVRGDGRGRRPRPAGEGPRRPPRAWSRPPSRRSCSPCFWLTTRELALALSSASGAALVLLAVRLVQRSTPAVRAQRALRHRDRLAVRPGGRQPRWERGRPGAGVLPARDPLQLRLRRGAGLHLPDRVAAGRLHGGQRHR